MALSDDESEVALLYRRHLPLVRGRALRILGDVAAADDVCQEVFVRYLKHRRQGNLMDVDTPAYLYTMATHTALNALRSGGRRHKNELRGAMSDAVAAVSEDTLAVRSMLSKVPKDLATMATYYYIDGLEHSEIAELTGLGRRTVGRRLEDFVRRARRLLGEAE